jgi:hypothetical protein
MGELQIFDVSGFKNKFNLEVFVETGTGNGHSLKHVLDVTKYNKFKKYFSIEIFKPLYEECLQTFSGYTDYDISILNQSSYDGLIDILTQIPKEQNIFFWLDAHFPGADFKFTSYGNEKEKELRIPLEEEIKLIKKHRPLGNDFIIIDDLRIYEDGNYEGGNWNQRHLYGGNGIQFIYDAFAETHEITKLNNHQGYVVLVPKENEE